MEGRGGEAMASRIWLCAHRPMYDHYALALDGQPQEWQPRGMGSSPEDWQVSSLIQSDDSLGGGDMFLLIDPIRDESVKHTSREVAIPDSVSNGHFFRERSEEDLFVFHHLNHTGGESIADSLRNAVDHGGASFLTVPDVKTNDDVL